MNRVVFELKGVSFRYPQGEAVLRELNLEIREGERLCILGANGCGKSTFLKLLSGLVFAEKGAMSAFGEPVDAAHFGEEASSAYHRKVGFIFQDSEVQLFCSTVYEELAFGPLQTGLPRETVKSRVEELARLLGIEKLLDQPPYRLSGGEKKKVAIGSVLILNPDVLILDEPTNSLDPRSVSWLLRLLDSLHGAGKTLIFATHNLALASVVSDRAVLFGEDHAVAAEGPTKELLKDTELLKRVNLVDDTYAPEGL